MRTSKARPKKKVRVVSEEVKQQRAAKREQRKHRDQIRAIFANAGFAHIADMEGKEFEFGGAKSDFDDIFIIDNIIIITEYTNSSPDKVESHLLKKGYVYSTINNDQSQFVCYLREQFPSLSQRIDPVFNNENVKVIFLYCSRRELKESAKAKVAGVKFLDYVNVMYFKILTSTVRKSARYEILDFLGIAPAEFGRQVVSPHSKNSDTYSCSVLPEANSHYPLGFKVVSFYVDADALLKRAYVLRKEGWRTGGHIYQRMIERSKVDKIRKHLIDNKGVFINNIIVTLPVGTKILDANDDTIDTKLIKSTTAGVVQLSTKFNSIGIIDGQHRVFSYHEGGIRDDEVAQLRAQQNLLVTGVMFPSNYGDNARAKFEARLFLEINSNQKSPKSALKQEIGLILRPFAPESIARRVLNDLNTKNGPLEGEFQKFDWEKDKIRTTTIVSYGLKPLVRIDGSESLYNIWPHPDRDKIDGDDLLLESYVSFCVKEINAFMSAFKAVIPKSRWTADRKNSERILTTTIVNGAIACIRRLAATSKIGGFDFYRTQLAKMGEFDFAPYKSSHYNKLGADLADEYFGKGVLDGR
jgi:DGQHR domain-containing protein